MLAQALGTLANQLRRRSWPSSGRSLPGTQVALLGAYKPFPATPSSPFAPFAVPAIRGLNGVIQGLAPQFGATSVDTYTPFLGLVSLAARSRVPGRAAWAGCRSAATIVAAAHPSEGRAPPARPSTPSLTSPPPGLRSSHPGRISDLRPGITPDADPGLLPIDSNF